MLINNMQISVELTKNSIYRTMKLKKNFKEILVVFSFMFMFIGTLNIVPMFGVLHITFQQCNVTELLSGGSV